jgi:PiT family inorganic phosphate transporter
LLPSELLLDTNIYHNVALILALLLTAIIWNLGTWWFGIPCSSSHTLIGSMIGVGLAYSLIAVDDTHSFVNWGKASEIGLSLFLSPVLGFSFAILLMYIMRQVIKNRVIFREPASNAPPPFWIRLILLLTCTGVSFSHGSNDGQKGVGLVMLILIAIVPAYFTIDISKNSTDYKELTSEVITLVKKINPEELTMDERYEYNKSLQFLNEFDSLMASGRSLKDFSAEEKLLIRKDMLMLGGAMKILLASKNISLSAVNKVKLKKTFTQLKSITDYAPIWVILMISLSLGLGTMIGWKRIVVTIGEKIGKQHLTYAQGASAEIVAASTIGFSTWLGLPVSTTHVLSSGIAGSMVASKGIKNLQTKTIKNIAIAWLLTLPVCVLVSGLLFLLFRAIM